eukprot:15357231-Ditylum_brightwellii.AAC.1
MQQHCTPQLEVSDHPPITERNDKGFGSTGVHTARRDTSHLPIDGASRIPMVEEVQTNEELVEVHKVEPSHHDDKGHTKKIDRSEQWQEKDLPLLETREDDTASTASENASWSEDEATHDESWEINSMAMDDDNWESTWVQHEEGPRSTQELLLSPNTKTRTSIPMQTRAQNVAEEIQADSFWHQVLKKQHDKESLMDTLYPSGLENSTTDGPCYTEYTEEEWNDVLTHQPQHPRTDSQPTNKPVLSPADCVSSTRPVTMSYTTEIFQKAVGFRNIHPLLKHMTRVGQNTLHVKDLGTDMVRDPGELATLPKSKRNTNPITKPEKFGDVVHFDIVYGLGTAIGGYRYALWLVDRATRYVFEYPLKTLQEDELLKAIQLFRRDCGGRLPSRMIADRDFKLIRGKMAKFLEGINWDADMARAMGQCS